MEKNARPVNIEDYYGRRCFTAVDLSTTIDISGYCHCFPPEGDERYYALFWRFFIPEDNLRERSLREDVPYDVWIDQGYVIATHGDVIDYDYIHDEILKDAESFDIVELPHDPYNATQLINRLTDEGINCVQFNQSISSMSPAVKNFERLVLKGLLATDGNPVMDYMIGCAEVYSDSNNNMKVVKPDRRTSNKRVDGVIMGIMATYRACVAEENNGPSVYEERGLITV